MAAMNRDRAEAPARRPVRSYVLREGRLTPAQRNALEKHWPRFGIEPPPGALDLAGVFGRDAAVVMEIGFGNGEVLAAMAAADPATDFLGLEVWRPGIGALLQKAAAEELSNLRIIRGDAAAVVSRNLAGAGLDRVMILFPDPWPKRRHHKRRLVQPAFIGALAQTLRDGGHLHLATDWPPYARAMRDAVAAAGLFTAAATERPAWRPLSRFERRARAQGRRVFNLLYEAGSAGRR